MIDFKNGGFFKLKENNEYASRVTDLLVAGEKVVGAFKALRDGVVFTNKRIIAVNVQGITGSKKDYTSLPYSKIVVFSVETAGGIVRMTVLGETRDGVLDIEAEMGRASIRSADVGLDGPDRVIEDEPLELDAGDRVNINTVSVGNPHAVVFVDALDPEDLRRRAPQISSHPSFERGINVQFAHAAGGAAVDALVWETSASGSSACAVAAAAVRRGLVSNRQVEVRMPGGSLGVHVRDDYTLLLRGPVEVVYEGRLATGMLERLKTLGWP